MFFRPGILLAVALMAAPFSAQSQDANYGNQKAYEYALRCFVAGGISVPKPADDPSGAITKSVREHARKSFDTVYYMGEKLGYSEARIATDLDHAQAMEARLMLQSPAYFASTKADCVKLGLM